MNKSEIKVFSTSSIIIGGFVWLLSFWVYGFKVFSFASLKAINLGVIITSLFWFGYFKWAWKWSYINKLLYRPNVNGTWLGEFKSDWKNEKGQENPPGKFVLVIRQQWLLISIRAFTQLQKTESYVETMMFDDSKGIKLLTYLYSEKRIGTGDHGARQGAAELDIVEDSKMRLLEGHFWTQAGTRGYIKVKQISSSSYVESFEQANEKWTESISWGSLSTPNC